MSARAPSRWGRARPQTPARCARPAALAATLVLCGVACGGGQTRGQAFDARRRDDGTAMAALQKQLAAVPIPLGADVAVGAFGERSLVGVPLTGGNPWTFEHPIACRPIIAGSIVVGLGANEMFGLEAKTGKKLWARKAAGCPRGAADDGKVTLVSARPITGSGGIVLAIARDGQVMRQIEDRANIGAPGLIDGFAFLPWDGRYVSAYDLSLGQEVARVKLTDRVTRAFALGGALFFGERSATRFDDRIGQAPEDGASSVRLPARELPAHPEWLGSGNDSPPLGPNAADSAALFARPLSRGAPGISGGRYATTDGRVALGLDAANGALVWAHAHAARFLGGAAYEGGFALCDGDGKITFLDAQTGAEAGSVSLGVPVDTCVVQADAFAKTKLETVPLRDSIAEIIRLKNEDAVPIQKFLLRELAVSGDERASETLIDLLASDAVSPDLVPGVRAALAARRSGASIMLAALAKRPDFLDDESRRAPVGPLAEALAGMRDKRAAPLLVEHLLDPDAPAGDVERAAAALEELAGPAELPALRAFFAAYRSEASEAPIVLAVVHVAAALERLGEREVVMAALRDKLTSEAVRGKIAPVMAALPGGSPAQ